MPMTGLTAVSRHDAIAVDRALHRLTSAPVVKLGRWPTPVSMGQSSAGAVLIKRDDLSGFGRGGAKTRKFEGLAGHLNAGGYDELITFAGNITNLGFDILPVLREQRVRPTLLVVDDPPMAPASRERHFADIRHDLHLLGPGRLAAARAAARAYGAARANGRRALVVLPGCSHPSAILGNARGLVELAQQRKLPGTIFVSVATGNTIAGFLIGAALLHMTGYPPIRIVGVQVYPGRIPLLARALIRWTWRWLGVRQVPPLPLEIVTSELTGTFGAYPDRLIDLSERVAATNGIAIDPIFGAKTWSAMEAMMTRGEVTGDCLYWHCGYTPEWRDLRAEAGRGEARQR